jgi:hypothetical protein
MLKELRTKMKINSKWFLVIIIAVGIFLRLHNGAELFNYNHDQDLAGWVIKDVLINHHLRLIGQLTSTPGVFIGAFFYYLLIPFYLVFRMDPIGGIYLVALIGAFAVWSCFYVFSKMFNEKVGLISALIYALSPYIVFNDREVVPTMPLMLWSIWFFYSLHLILKGDQKKGFLLAAILIAFIWHINLGLVILLPIYVVALILSKKKLDFKVFLLSTAILIVLSAPLIFFEARHGFSQTKAIFLSTTQGQGDILRGTAKAAKIFDVVVKDVTNLIWGYPAGIPNSLAFWLVSAASLVVFLKGKIKKDIFYIMTLWFGITVGFFTLYSKTVSEYYLNSLTIVWVAVSAIILENIIESKKFKYVGYLLLVGFSVLSFYRFFTYHANRQGYVERKEVIAYIKADALSRGFPCVSISYITSPGYNLGYRYFIWLDSLKTKEISTKVPVYSVVFPLSGVDKSDKYFGSLGVINPDYSRYNEKTINESCQGYDFNLTDSMFGYTQ